MSKRLNVGISDETDEFVREYMKRKGVSATEATRRAYAALRYIDEANRKRITILAEEDGRIRELVFLV